MMTDKIRPYLIQLQLKKGGIPAVLSHILTVFAILKTAAINIFLTKHEGYTGRLIWPEVFTIWTECRKVCTKMTKG